MEIKAAADKSEFIIDQFVVYGTAGICQLTGKEKRSFDGINENDYYKIIPINSQNSVYYVPTDNAKNKMRHLLTKEEIFSLIDKMPDIEPCWPINANERKNMFGTMLKSDDYEKIICVIKSFHCQQEMRELNKKKLSSLDEKTMKAAETMMYQEFGMVLDIPPEDIENMILERLEKESVI